MQRLNIQIFGTKKSADTRKAERFFKERGIRFQSVDLLEKGLSKREFVSVVQAVGGLDRLIDPNCRDKDTLDLVMYLAEEDRWEKAFENQQAHLLHAAGHGTQSVKRSFQLVGDDLCQGGLPHARRSPQDEGGDMPRVYHLAQNSSRTYQMLLSDIVVKGLGA